MPKTDASDAAFGGYRTALIAASPISSGNGQARPIAFALSTTFFTVVFEHLHENEMFRMLTPHGVQPEDLTILDHMLFLSLMATAPYAPHADCRKEGAPHGAPHW